MSNIYVKARKGHGVKVHAVSAGGWQYCGAGKSSIIGGRREYDIQYTPDAITCKSCLREIERRGLVEATKQPNDAIVTTPAPRLKCLGAFAYHTNALTLP